MRVTAPPAEAADMVAASPDWRPNQAFAAGRGATVQRFVAIVGSDKLEIDVTPWGDGSLRVNGYPAAHVNDAADGGQAFRKLIKSRAVSWRDSPCSISKPSRRRRNSLR